MHQNPCSPAAADTGVADEFRNFIAASAFPCVGAKSALNRERLEIVVCDEMDTDLSAQLLCQRVAQFSESYPDPGQDPVSLVAIFKEPAGSEDDFHSLLWRQLQRVHDLDARTFPWAPGISANPAANDFSFSVASRAFFVVGLHPLASRLARRAPRPTLVFNFHEQFEAMKASGRYAKLQTAIRQRDISLQGDINPVLAQFGEGSEARQYSGKNGGGCPFRAQKAVA